MLALLSKGVTIDERVMSKEMETKYFVLRPRRKHARKYREWYGGGNFLLYEITEPGAKEALKKLQEFSDNQLQDGDAVLVENLKGAIVASYKYNAQRDLSCFRDLVYRRKNRWKLSFPFPVVPFLLLAVLFFLICMWVRYG